MEMETQTEQKRGRGTAVVERGSIYQYKLNSGGYCTDSLELSFLLWPE